MMNSPQHEQRRKLIEENRNLLDRVDADGRPLTSEETTAYDKRDAEIEQLTATIKRSDLAAQRDAEIQTEVDRAEEARARAALEVAPPESQAAAPADAQARYSKASDEYRDAHAAYLRGQSYDARALSEGTDSAGGYLVPNQWMDQLTQGLEDAFIMRNRASIFTTTSGTMNLPTVSAHGSAAWRAEAGAIAESDETFSNVTWGAFSAGRLMKVSEELLADNQYDLQAYITQEYIRSIGAVQEAAFINGDGSSKPTGVVVGSTLGVTAASATAITSDEIIDLYHALGRPYRRTATWVANDSTIKLIRKLKDGDSQYLWQPGMAAGEPDRLLGSPVEASGDMPAATTGLKSLIYGDLSYYYIQDRAGVSVVRLDELYRANGQIGFAATARTDGKLTIATAVYHLIQA